MRESDLRVLFKRQASIELPPAPISIPAVRRIGRVRLLRRRTARVASPILAAAAVVAVVLLAVLFTGGPSQPANTPGLRAAPALFNPLVPYAAVTWYPYQPSQIAGTDWRTALLLRASTRSPAQSTEVVLYADGWCTLQSASLSCGSTAAGTRAEMPVSGQAPDVQGQPAYWTRYASGNLGALRPSGGTSEMVAFEYAPGGWAVVESTGTQADVLRIAASLRYGQTSPLRFPFRLTGMPSAWSEVLLAGFTQAGPGVHAPTGDTAILGSPATRPGTELRTALTIHTSTQTTQPPTCRTTTVPPGPASQPASCPSNVINGYRVFPASASSPGQQTLFAPDADGLYLYVQSTGTGAPLSLSGVLARHLQLLGPDPANWTTTPVSP